MVRSKDQKKKVKTKKGKTMKAFIFNLDSHPLKHPMKKVVAMPVNQDDWSSSQSLEDSLTPAAGWSWTRTHTAWMVEPSLNFANHLTHMVLDMGCTHAAIEGVGLIASLASWRKTPLIQPKSLNSTSPHMFRGGLTFHKSNEYSKLIHC